MTPSEYAKKLPEWVIPEYVDRDQLRFELKILLEEYEKPIHLVAYLGWSHLTAQPRDPAIWSGYLSRYATFNQLCTPAHYLKGAMRQVLRATVPTDTWTVVNHLRVEGDFPLYRAIRLEWLKLLERKLNADV